MLFRHTGSDSSTKSTLLAYLSLISGSARNIYLLACTLLLDRVRVTAAPGQKLQLPTLPGCAHLKIEYVLDSGALEQFCSDAVLALS